MHCLELRHFANVAIINGGSTESVYGICIDRTVSIRLYPVPHIFQGYQAHAQAVCTRPSPLLRRAWERGYCQLGSYDGLEFPGEITSCGETDAEVNVIHRSGSAWRWPTNPDKIFYEHANIVRQINPPKAAGLMINLHLMIFKW